MTTPTTPVDLLVAAQARIADEMNWCTTRFAEDAEGHGCPLTAARATRWCALGALMVQAWGPDLPPLIELGAREYLGRAARELFPGRRGIDQVNDTEGHAAIMRCYARAIELARAAAAAAS